MTTTDALALIDDVLSQINVNRQTHLDLLEALAVLRTATTKKEE